MKKRPPQTQTKIQAAKRLRLTGLGAAMVPATLFLIAAADGPKVPHTEGE